MENEVANAFRELAKNFGLDGALIASVVIAVNLLKNVFNLEANKERAKKWAKVFPFFALVLSIVISGFFYEWKALWPIVFSGLSYWIASTGLYGLFKNYIKRQPKG